jgi:tetratricopeptide (TPR) repeat protein
MGKFLSKKEVRERSRTMARPKMTSAMRFLLRFHGFVPIVTSVFSASTMIFHRRANSWADTGGLMAPAKSGAKKTLIIFTIVNAAAILSLTAVFSVVTSGDISLMREVLLSSSADTALVKSKAAVMSSGSGNSGTSVNTSIVKSKASIRHSIPGSSVSLKEFSSRIESFSRADSEILSVILFSKTADDNYFTVRGKIEIDPRLAIPVSSGERVRESEENWLKKGIYEPCVNPVLFAEKSAYWHNAYVPVTLKEGQFVVRISVSSAGAVIALENHIRRVSRAQIGAVLLSALLIIITLVASFLFLKNFSLFMSGIAGYVKKAADGNTDLELNEDADEDLFELAMSFNTLVGELKEKERQITRLHEKERDMEKSRKIEKIDYQHDRELQQQIESLKEELSKALAEKNRMIAESNNSDELSESFRTGVELLKRGRLDDAEAIFRALTIVKPDGFGAYFNLGVVYAKKREFDRSIGMFERAIEINPNHPHAAQYIEKVMRLHSGAGGA